MWVSGCKFTYESHISNFHLQAVMTRPTWRSDRWSDSSANHLNSTGCRADTLLIGLCALQGDSADLATTLGLYYRKLAIFGNLTKMAVISAIRLRNAWNCTLMDVLHIMDAFCLLGRVITAWGNRETLERICWDDASHQTGCLLRLINVDAFLGRLPVVA